MSETPQEHIEGVPDDLVEYVDPQIFKSYDRNKQPPQEQRTTQRPER